MIKIQPDLIKINIQKSDDFVNAHGGSAHSF